VSEREDLVAALARADFTPGARHFADVFALLEQGTDREATRAERALVRAGDSARRAAITRLDDDRATPVLRARLCRLLGRLGGDDGRAALIARLGDDDARVRRAAAGALGRLPGPGVADALRARWHAQPAPDASERRALAAALGKVGDASADELLASVRPDGDPELARIVERARLMLARSRPDEAAGIDETRAPRAPRAVRLHCRPGLERLLADELAGVPSLTRVRTRGAGAVDAELSGPLSTLHAAHLWIDLGFPLADRLSVRDGAAADQVIAALLSDEATAVFDDFSRGTPRFRLEWVGRGARRAVTWRIAASVAAREGGPVNAPRGAPWEARISGDAADRFSVELIARGLADPRFAWRVADVPAASHPTVAAALARAADVRPMDVVWDPFVGSGGELVACARLAPGAHLHGTDLDPRAIHAARRNLDAAGVEATLDVGDALTTRPAEAPTLIISNPPMGRRVARGRARTLLENFVPHAAAVLAPGGRLVWASPEPERTLAAAGRAGLSCELRLEFDMGGFPAELQRLRKP
jgi:precorrin-6B methylase 2